MQIWTYSAAGTIRRAIFVIVATAILAVRVLALANEVGEATVVAYELDGVVKLVTGCRQVLEDRKPSSTVAVAHTQIERRIVAGGSTWTAPFAGILDWHAFGIDVVLS